MHSSLAFREVVTVWNDDVEERLDTLDKRVWGAVAVAATSFGTVILGRVSLLH